MRYALFVPIPGTPLAERVISGGAVVASVSAQRGDILYLLEPAPGDHARCDSPNYASRVMSIVENAIDGTRSTRATRASRGDALKVGEYDDWTGTVHVTPSFAAHAALRRWIGVADSDDVFRANLRTEDIKRKVRRVLEVADDSLHKELLEALRAMNHLDWLKPRPVVFDRDRRRHGPS